MRGKLSRLEAEIEQLESELTDLNAKKEALELRLVLLEDLDTDGEEILLIEGALDRLADEIGSREEDLEAVREEYDRHEANLMRKYGG